LEEDGGRPRKRFASVELEPFCEGEESTSFKEEASAATPFFVGEVDEA
jgi:hypothetical protein